MDRPDREAIAGCLQAPSKRAQYLGPPAAAPQKAGARRTRSVSRHRGTAFTRSPGPASPSFRHQLQAHNARTWGLPASLPNPSWSKRAPLTCLCRQLQWPPSPPGRVLQLCWEAHGERADAQLRSRSPSPHRGDPPDSRRFLIPLRHRGEPHNWSGRRDPQDRINSKYVVGRERSSLRSVLSGRHLCHVPESVIML
ncbi:hypothetical protein NDU88_000223 [Pleurodeles waltl]|uniref:Uncharacterized protein n=1 Tax=Pleurodeles waltl TaxID=8319 RepID=A0AAV7VSV5_PLEWA|nr:hypothetical protein NDU88_000223 [Pleurodeles waltl]